MASSGKITAAILASGNGSNAENILRFAQGRSDISIPIVICNKEGAGVIERARKLGVPCEVITGPRREQEEKVLASLQKRNVNWVLLAGYMQIISPAFLARFADKTLGVNRVINIHPSLLPQFPGKDGYVDAWNTGVRQSGVTLHFVDEGVDTGPVIAQKVFSRFPDDTLDSFRARGMEAEYGLYTEFLGNLCAGIEKVQLVRQAEKEEGGFVQHFSDAIILTKDNRILMQQRAPEWSACSLTAFGGRMEAGETPMQGLVRELKEELGAEVDPADVVHIGSVVESLAPPRDIVHVHFWHDRCGTITGCYEWWAAYYDSVDAAICHPKIMDYARWALLECRARGLLDGEGRKA